VTMTRSLGWVLDLKISRGSAASIVRSITGRSPASARHCAPRRINYHVNSLAHVADSPSLGTYVWTFSAVQLLP